MKSGAKKTVEKAMFWYGLGIAADVLAHLVLSNQALSIIIILVTVSLVSLLTRDTISNRMRYTFSSALITITVNLTINISKNVAVFPVFYYAFFALMVSLILVCCISLVVTVAVYLLLTVLERRNTHAK